MGSDIVLRKHNGCGGMFRIQSYDLLIEFHGIFPVLFFLLDLGQEKIRIDVFRIDREDITKGHSSLWEIAGFNEFLRPCTILSLPLSLPTAGYQYERHSYYDDASVFHFVTGCQ